MLMSSRCLVRNACKCCVIDGFMVRPSTPTLSSSTICPPWLQSSQWRTVAVADAVAMREPADADQPQGWSLEVGEGLAGTRRNWSTELSR